MTQSSRTIGDSSLIDLLDRLIETGVVATGDVLLGLADVDLIRVNLQLVLGAVDTLMADDATQLDATQLDAAWSDTARSDAGRGTHDDAPREDVVAPHSPAIAPPTDHAGSPTEQRGMVVGGPVPNAPRPPAPAPQLGRPDDRADLGVGGLLVAVIEIVHRLLERQAIHRMEHGSLTSDQIERLGQALMLLDQRIGQLIEIFGVRSSSALPATVVGNAPLGGNS